MFNLALLLQRNNKHAEAAEYWRRYLANDTQSEWGSTGASVLKILRNANAPVGVLTSSGTRPKERTFWSKASGHVHARENETGAGTAFERATGPRKVCVTEVKCGLPPIYDDGFARGTGEIIARATAHMKDALHRRGKLR